MATNKKDTILECAFSSLNNVVSFAKFVSYAEDLAQLNELFEDEKAEIIIRGSGLNWKSSMHLLYQNGRMKDAQ